MIRRCRLVLCRLLTATLIVAVPMSTSGFSRENIFAVEYVFKIVNGACVDQQFYMIPAEHEYRMPPFRRFNATGASKSPFTNGLINGSRAAPLHTFTDGAYAERGSSRCGRLDLQTAARHDAICNLLIRHGLMSVKSDRCYQNDKQLDEILIRYQGFVKHPFKVVSQGYMKNSTGFRVEMEIRFAPLAFPGQWSSLYRRKVLHDTFERIRSFF